MRRGDRIRLVRLHNDEGETYGVVVDWYNESPVHLLVVWDKEQYYQQSNQTWGVSATSVEVVSRLTIEEMLTHWNTRVRGLVCDRDINEARNATVSNRE